MGKSGILRSKAPLRISFGGGGTDVDPYRSQYGGCTLSTSIDKYAYVSCRPRTDNVIQAQSLDYNIVAQYDTQQAFVMDGELDLAKAVIGLQSSDSEFGRNGRAAVLAKYNWGRDSARLLSAVERVTAPQSVQRDFGSPSA